MKVEIRKITDWDLVYETALATIDKKVTKEPSDAWKRKILNAEHSPIRALQFLIKLEGIPYFVSTHLVRHKIGVEHYVSTSREDRTGIKREERKQTDLVNHTMLINAQALITMSRKRLCTMADAKTREVWRAVKEEIKKVEPILAEFMVPECVYRQGCHEFKPCGYFKKWKEGKVND